MNHVLLLWVVSAAAFGMSLIPNKTVVVASNPETPVITQQEKEILDETATSSLSCQCVTYLQERGIAIRGNALDAQPNVDSPLRGDVLLLVYKDKHTGEPVGHGVFIEAPLLTGDWISERNFVACKDTERFIPHDDPHRRGYYRAI